MYRATYDHLNTGNLRAKPVGVVEPDPEVELSPPQPGKLLKLLALRSTPTLATRIARRLLGIAERTVRATYPYKQHREEKSMRSDDDARLIRSPFQSGHLSWRPKRRADREACRDGDASSLWTMAARVAVGFYVCCMIETPQPLPNNHTKILIWTLIGVAIFVLCLTFVVFLGPFVMFAWIADRQADWFERQGPELNFIWMPASLPSRVLPFSVQS